MTKYVVCQVQVEGLHCWPEASGPVSYLQHIHRHIFVILVEFSVNGSNREVEIITRQGEIRRYLLDRYGEHNDVCHFSRMSCEDIACELLEAFSAASCTVLEDGLGGARVVR